MIEEIFFWEIVCTPWNKGQIRSMTICVEAKTRKEAELIVLDNAHKFFNRDMNYVWGEPLSGYHQV